jgi:hypothetical protein
LNIYPTMIGPIVADDVEKALADAADELSARRGTRIDPEFLRASPHIFVNSIDGFVERFQQIREEYGISSFMVGELGPLDAVVERLAGT